MSFAHLAQKSDEDLFLRVEIHETINDPGVGQYYLLASHQSRSRG